MVNIFISPMLFMPITSFCLSVFCRMRGLSHTLGKRFSKAELSADVHHPLNEGISSDVNSPGISHLFSQLISDGEHFFLTLLLFHLFCLCPLLFSFICVCIAGYVNSLILLARRSAVCWRSSPPSLWCLQWSQLHWHISLILTAHLWCWMFRSHPYFLCLLLSSLCLSFAGWAKSLALLARSSE